MVSLTTAAYCAWPEFANAVAKGSTYIEFDDVEVSVENLLGEENHGFEIIMSSESNQSVAIVACIN